MSSPEKELTAVLYSEAEPTAQQRARFEKFLAGKYGREVPLIWMREEAAGRLPSRGRDGHLRLEP